MRVLLPYFLFSGLPTHIEVMEWRDTLERLNRLTCLCNRLIEELIQKLVLKAINSLLFIMKRLVRLALDQATAQDENFALMRERVTSNPFTKGILERLDISLDDEAHIGLVSMQASSFSTLLSSLEAGWLLIILSILHIVYVISGCSYTLDNQCLYKGYTVLCKLSSRESIFLLC